MNPTSDPHQGRKVSMKRRGADPGTATSSAAQAAIQQVIERRDRRKVFAPPARPSRAAPRGTPAAWNVVRGLVFAGIVAVVWQAVAGVGARRPAVRGSDTCGFAGKVVFEGRPLVQAVLELHPLEGGAGASPLPVETDDTGAFCRPASHGVAAGRYAVVVRSGCVMPRPGAEIGTPVTIPARYLRPESTPLEVAVDDSTRLDLVITR